MPQENRSLVKLTPAKIRATAEDAEADLLALDPLPQKIRKLKMVSDESYEILMDEGRHVRDVQRQVEEKQKSLTSICDTMKKEIRNLFKPMLNACRDVLGIVEEKRFEYDRWLTQEREKEQERLDAEAAKEMARLVRNAKRRAARADTREAGREIINSVPQIEAREAEPAEAPRVAGVSVAKIWDFEIEDERKVPEFFEDQDGDCIKLWDRKFNREALLAICRAMMTADGNPLIPGVRFFQKDSPRYGRL